MGAVSRLSRREPFRRTETIREECTRYQGDLAIEIHDSKNSVLLPPDLLLVLPISQTELEARDKGVWLMQSAKVNP